MPRVHQIWSHHGGTEQSIGHHEKFCSRPFARHVIRFNLSPMTATSPSALAAAKRLAAEAAKLTVGVAQKEVQH